MMGFLTALLALGLVGSARAGDITDIKHIVVRTHSPSSPRRN